MTELTATTDFLYAMKWMTAKTHQRGIHISEGRECMIPHSYSRRFRLGHVMFPVLRASLKAVLSNG